jgi:excisionase family DNA binding protein
MNAYETVEQAGDERGLVSVADAARLLRVSQSTLWRWISHAEVPAYRIGPKRVWVKTADLERLLRPLRGHGQKGGVALRQKRASERRLTTAQTAKMLAAADQAKQFQKMLLTKRGGELFGPAADEIHAAREERDRQLP